MSDYVTFNFQNVFTKIPQTIYCPDEDCNSVLFWKKRPELLLICKGRKYKISFFLVLNIETDVFLQTGISGAVINVRASL